VLEVLESSFKGTLSAQLHDLHHLQESILKTKQHMEIMMWSIRHQLLENVRSRYSNFSSWRSHVRERKLAAIKRSWPDVVNNSTETTKQDGSLFIEDALVYLDIEQGNTQEMGEELEVASLLKDRVSSILRSKIEGVAGCYPFENLRAAVDILFLLGSSDLVVAKQAIVSFVYFHAFWIILLIIQTCNCARYVWFP
jgi:E3 ubiquitin-protein ligase HOS1